MKQKLRLVFAPLILVSIWSMGCATEETGLPGVFTKQNAMNLSVDYQAGTSLQTELSSSGSKVSTQRTMGPYANLVVKCVVPDTAIDFLFRVKNLGNRSEGLPWKGIPGAQYVYTTFGGTNLRKGVAPDGVSQIEHSAGGLLTESEGFHFHAFHTANMAGEYEIHVENINPIEVDVLAGCFNGP